jgi:hypothetical protein
MFKIRKLPEFRHRHDKSTKKGLSASLGFASEGEIWKR